MLNKLGNMLKGGGSSSSWSWNNNGTWQPFDSATSKQIDTEINHQWNSTSQIVLIFPLSKGPWFGQPQNRGVYFCHVQLDPARANITSVTQHNQSTGFARQMKRTPAFIYPQNAKRSSSSSSSSPTPKKRLSTFLSKRMSKHSSSPTSAPTTTSSATSLLPSSALNSAIAKDDGSFCWSWRNDYLWEEYDSATSLQIESAYRAGASSVNLNQGGFFGSSSRKNVYCIQFQGNTIPASFIQVNSHTGFTRQVARTDQNDTDDSKQQQNSSKGAEQDSEWRQFYRPMTRQRFDKLKEKEKMCNICFLEFEDAELFESQCAPFKAALSRALKATKEASQDSIVAQDSVMAQDDAMEQDDVEQGDSATDTKNEDEAKVDSDQVESVVNEEWRKICREFSGDIRNDTIIHLSECANDDHYFHTECIVRWLNEKGKCCHCQRRYAVETGNQPDSGSQLTWTFMKNSCSGFDAFGTIKVGFNFEGGVQGQEHYHPGAPYPGEYREAYFPNNRDGREALELTKIGWKRRLLFTIGTSLTTKRENCVVWTSIHFKTRMDGGEQNHGWPDATYLSRFKEELKAKGVSVEDLDQSVMDAIKYGY